MTRRCRANTWLTLGSSGKKEGLHTGWGRCGLRRNSSTSQYRSEEEEGLTGGAGPGHGVPRDVGEEEGVTEKSSRDTTGPDARRRSYPELELQLGKGIIGMALARLGEELTGGREGRREAKWSEKG